MRDRLAMTQVGLCLVLALILLTGCPPEEGGGSAASDSPSGTAADQNDGQRLGYVSGETTTAVNRAGQDSSTEEVMVGMTDALTYVPEEVTIRVGQTVVWRNTSGMNHTVTADPKLAKDRRHVRLPEGAQPFDSGHMPPGATFRHTFEVPGLYVYFCIPHETAGMVGRVEVREKE